MRDDNIDRLLQTSLAAIPACLGLFAFLNNVTDWNGSVTRVVYPLLSMAENSAAATQGWRALESRVSADICYGFVTLLELIMGLLAGYGAFIMVRSRQNMVAFARGKRLVGRACMLGVFIYCFIFFVIGGDWFLAWKNENLLFLQGDALNYALVLTIVLVLLRGAGARAEATHPD